METAEYPVTRYDNLTDVMYVDLVPPQEGMVDVEFDSTGQLNFRVHPSTGDIQGVTILDWKSFRRKLILGIAVAAPIRLFKGFVSDRHSYVEKKLEDYARRYNNLPHPHAYSAR